MGFSKDGKITAAEAIMAYEAGAFPGSPVGPGTMCVFAPYRIANFRIKGMDVLVNKPKAAAYRAPGAPKRSSPRKAPWTKPRRSLGSIPSSCACAMP